MADYILAHQPESGWHKVEERDLPDEATLQNLIRDNPEVLPLDDLGDDIPPLLVVGRETALANGYVDVIGVDEDGLVTLIECKLDRNPQVKREVIGQILGYAAFLWQMTYEQFEQDVARKYYDSARSHRSDLRGVGLEEAMKRFREERGAETDWNEENFRQRLADNLKNGAFRLIIVVDKVNDELRQTVEYLNNCTAPNFQIVCAELRYFAADETQLLVPALIGTPAARAAQRGGRAPSRKWDAAQFFAVVRQNLGESTAKAAQKLLQWSEQTFDYVWWGEGQVDGSFVPSLRWNADRSAKPFVVYSYGRVEVTFQYLKSYPPFNNEARRKELLHRLNKIDGIALPENTFDRRPSFELQLLTNGQTFEAFTAAIGEAVAELRLAQAALPKS